MGNRPADWGCRAETVIHLPGFRFHSQFKNAGVLWHQVANREPDPARKADFAKKAFAALGAAGDTTDANALGQEYPNLKTGIGKTPSRSLD